MNNERLEIVVSNKKEALLKLKQGVKTDDCPITHFIDHPNMTIVTDLEEFKEN